MAAQRHKYFYFALWAAGVLALVLSATACANDSSGPADPAAGTPSPELPSAGNTGFGVPAAETSHPAAAGSVPGTDPSIQRWLLQVEKTKIAFNDALLQAERGVATHVSSDCQVLDTTVRRIAAELPGLTSASPAGAQVAAAFSPVMDTMAALAKDCLAGNWNTAVNDMNTGISQQADAQVLVDEILDGDK